MQAKCCSMKWVILKSLKQDIINIIKQQEHSFDKRCQCCRCVLPRICSAGENHSSDHLNLTWWWLCGVFLQIGTFTTHSGQFFLEPLLSADGDEYEEEHNKPHLLYRHESHDSQPCSASGKRFSFINPFSKCIRTL